MKFPRCERLAEWIGCGWHVVNAVLTGAANVHDKGKWGKKVLLYSTLYITFKSLAWAFEYTISQSGKPGIDTAAVIAAVMGPIAAMQAAVFKFYLTESTDRARIAAGQETGGD